MEDAQADQVLGALEKLWPSQKPIEDATRAGWGAALVRYDYRPAMVAVMALLETCKWRPTIAEVVGKIREASKRRALTEAKRLALAPAPGPFVAPERVDEIMAPVIEGMRPIADVLPLAKTDDQARVVLDRSMTAAMLLAHTEARAAAGERWAMGALAHVRAERERLREERTV